MADLGPDVAVRSCKAPARSRTWASSPGSLLEERTDWTQESRANLTAALGEALSARSAEIVPYREFGETIPWDPDHARMIRLYSAVGNAIRVADQLPTKRRLRETSGDLDYSLGDPDERHRKDVSVREG